MKFLAFTVFLIFITVVYGNIMEDAIAIAKGPTKTLFCDKHSWTRKLNCDLGMGRIATVATENASALDYKRTLYEGKREIVT